MLPVSELKISLLVSALDSLDNFAKNSMPYILSLYKSNSGFAVSNAFLDQEGIIQTWLLLSASA